jgi:V/A-type H+-transporting ATPase subunit E
MSSKIDALTQKIYAEGIEKANEQAKNIISEAEKKAEAILNDAKESAKKLKETAQQESSTIKKEVITELQNVSEQVIENLKQSITEILVVKTLNNLLDKSLNDKEFIKSAITTIIKNWNPESKSNDLTILLSKEKEEEFNKNFITALISELNNKVEIKFEKGFKDGFVIEPKDGNYKISFTKEDFISYFKSHLKTKVREILFKE